MSGVCLHRLLGQVCVLLAAVSLVHAGEAAIPVECFEEEVLAHVREQFAKYGPKSDEREYFGFIYLRDGGVESAVTYGAGCRGQRDCSVNPAIALARVPKGSRVVGEWHTHPHFGSVSLSPEDVDGAHANRHIRCYATFYSVPHGAIYRWDIATTSVPDAMASRAEVGNYRATIADLRAPVHSTANAAASTSGAIGRRESPACCRNAGSTANKP
jgi:hypothetical protein